MNAVDHNSFLVVRAKLEFEIERLIELLNAMDGDENLEDTGDLEPSLLGTCRAIGSQFVDDLERDHSDLEPNGDDELTLGWHERFGQKADIDHACLIGGAL